MTVTVLGIRHHGPGSARSVERALADLDPDLLLVEGPPEADALVPLVSHPELRPPVAILVYRADEPKAAAFWPLAEFSPEWRAIRHARAREIPVRFVDLPAAHSLAPADDEEPEERPPVDPLDAIAEAAGFADGDRWWEALVEERRDHREVFAAVLEVMAAAREGDPGAEAERELRREAYMRRRIREAAREGFERIAVVCGAWHAPVLVDGPMVKDDDALLKGLPKTKVEATLVPWTHGRLARASGYGAGVDAPGWYEHLFRETDRVAEKWVTRAARLLRKKGLDVSSAHAIEAVRLAEALAAMRERPAAGLVELTDAIRAVLLFGDDVPLALVTRGLVVGERLGRIPADTPRVPLQRDLEAESRRLRLKTSADSADLTLDLRKPIGLGRSVLLHRLRLLGIPWGEPLDAGRSKGTFREVWRIRWEPDFAIRVIEASRFGPTVAEASAARTLAAAVEATRTAELVDLLGEALFADLPAVIEPVLARVAERSALAGEVTEEMAAVPALARLARYGDVRGTATAPVRRILAGMIERIAAGLAPACASLDADSAERMAGRIDGVHEALSLEETDPGLRDDWLDALLRVADHGTAAGRVRGRSVRLLLDAERLPAAQAARRLGLALSPAADAAEACDFLVGFLGGSGLVLVHDPRLLSLVDGWLASVGEEAFVALLPLLRRAFADFPAPERRAIGERIAAPAAATREEGPGEEGEFDEERAAAALAVVEEILGGTR